MGFSSGFKGLTPVTVHWFRIVKFSLKIVAMCSSETSVPMHHTKWCYRRYVHANLKSYIYITGSLVTSVCLGH